MLLGPKLFTQLPLLFLILLPRSTTFDDVLFPESLEVFKVWTLLSPILSFMVPKNTAPFPVLTRRESGVAAQLCSTYSYEIVVTRSVRCKRCFLNFPKCILKIRVVLRKREGWQRATSYASFSTTSFTAETTGNLTFLLSTNLRCLSLPLVYFLCHLLKLLLGFFLGSIVHECRVVLWLIL